MWFELDLKLNVVDLVMLGVTIAIAWFVWRWDRRNSANALIWDSSREHWRTAMALLENKYEPGKDPADEIERRQLFVARTVRQIQMLEGKDSPLAKAFKAIAKNTEWHSGATPANANLVHELTYQMAKRFGSAKAQKAARDRLNSGV